jgi:hypothetical protein
VGGLLEQQFLVQRTVGSVALVGTVRVLHGTALLLRLRDRAQEFLAPLQQLLLEFFQPLLFHRIRSP